MLAARLRAASGSPDDPVHRVLEALGPNGPGFIVIRSRTLGGALVVWVRDDSTDLPEELRALPAYTWDELGALVSSRPSDLVDLHRIKAALDGTVIS